MSTTVPPAPQVLCIFGLTGLYARQVNEAWWLGLAGYLLSGLFFAHTLPLTSIEAFILPLLATEAPTSARSHILDVGAEWEYSKRKL